MTLAPLFPGGAATPLTTVSVASGLTDPLFVTHAPNDRDRIFIVEQPGTIAIIDIASEPPVSLGTFLDITSRVNNAGNEQGLLGLAFHYDYDSNGFFYVDYIDTGGDTQISRFSVTGDPNLANASSEVKLLSIAQPQSNHNGGWLAFGRDHYLYIATGDGGGSGDNDSGHTAGLGNSQDLTNNLLGKMLRIDVDASDGPGGQYGIPPSNPFVGNGGDDEIWLYGLRNPWRNAFDRLNGDLYIADVGQGSWEEIDYRSWPDSGGASLGWRCREGAHNFDFTGSCSSISHVEPVEEYSHGGSPFRCSITGGEVYRGCAVPDLRGSYFYADNCSDQIWTLEMQAGAAANQLERTSELDPPGAASIGSISSFGVDAEGEIYIVDLQGGEVFKIIPDGPAVGCPTPVPATGLEGSTLLASLLLIAAVASLGVVRRRNLKETHTS